MDDPEIVVAVMIERGGGGGSAAAPVARRIMEAYFGIRIDRREGNAFLLENQTWTG